MDDRTGGGRRMPARRDVLRMLAVGGAAGLAWKLGALPRGAASVSRTRVLMGTWVHLTALSMDREEAEAATEAALERMATLEARLSRFRAESELARLNRDGRLVDASDELLDLLRRADRFSELGDGAFDVTVQPLEQLYRERRDVGGPSGEELERALERVDRRAIRVEGRSVTLARGDMSVTLDGIGKGYIVDRGVETLQGLGYGDVFVEAGGDLVAAGDKGRAGPWRIGIRNPRPGGALHSRFEARDVAVATSGDYMQPFNADFSQHHILDPRTGRSAPELASSTVVAPDAATADALATLTMVLGPRRGRELLEALPGVEGLFIAKDLGVTRTSGFFTT